MSSGITDDGAAVFLSAMLGIEGLSGFYVALLSAEPDTTMDGNQIADLEPDDDSYARQHIATGEANWGLNGVYAVNGAAVSFGTPSVDWGPITHYALLDAATGGNLLAYGELLNPPYAAAGYAMTLPAGAILFALTAVQVPIAV